MAHRPWGLPSGCRGRSTPNAHPVPKSKGSLYLCNDFSWLGPVGSDPTRDRSLSANPCPECIKSSSLVMVLRNFDFQHCFLIYTDSLRWAWVQYSPGSSKGRNVHLCAWVDRMTFHHLVRSCTITVQKEQNNLNSRITLWFLQLQDGTSGMRMAFPDTCMQPVRRSSPCCHCGADWTASLPQETMTLLLCFSATVLNGQLYSSTTAVNTLARTWQWGRVTQLSMGWTPLASAPAHPPWRTRRIWKVSRHSFRHGAWYRLSREPRPLHRPDSTSTTCPKPGPTFTIGMISIDPGGCCQLM